eukprot:416316-Rhodomonas_salina.8
MAVTPVGVKVAVSVSPHFEHCSRSSKTSLKPWPSIRMARSVKTAPPAETETTLVPASTDWSCSPAKLSKPSSRETRTLDALLMLTGLLLSSSSLTLGWLRSGDPAAESSSPTQVCVLAFHLHSLTQSAS